METPLEDISTLIIGEWIKVRDYYKSVEDDGGGVDYRNTWLVKEAEPFMKELSDNYIMGEEGYSELQKEYLKKYVSKYTQFFKLLNKEEDEQYRNEQLFKALIQIPSEIEDFIKKHEEE